MRSALLLALAALVAVVAYRWVRAAAEPPWPEDAWEWCQ